MASKWDDTVATLVIRGTSPTAQVPKLFGPIYATASGESESAASGTPAVVAPLRCMELDSGGRRR